MADPGRKGSGYRREMSKGATWCFGGEVSPQQLVSVATGGYATCSFVASTVGLEDVLL